MEITDIVTDGDLDGLLSAAILLRIWPSANVHFTHPAEIRSGQIDHLINRRTAILDLPFHPACGLHIDHHLTNKPTPEQEVKAAVNGCNIVWREALSAARVCYDAFREEIDLADFEVWMPMVDCLDGGKISHQEFLSDHPIIWIGRTISATNPDYCKLLLSEISKGTTPDAITRVGDVATEITKSRFEFESMRNILSTSVSVVDRMAIVRIEEKGMRTNGYLVTAHVGADCDACMIVHGYLDGSVTNPDKWPLSTSFYSNSFLHTNGGVFDLTRLATAFDRDGGGHANACGCRIQPLSENGKLEHRDIVEGDIERNINAWLQIWSSRTSS
jgi:hypothetical protein